MLYMHIHFPIGTRPHLAQKKGGGGGGGGGGHVPEMPSPPRYPPMLSVGICMVISCCAPHPIYIRTYTISYNCELRYTT